MEKATRGQGYPQSGGELDRKIKKDLRDKQTQEKPQHRIIHQPVVDAVAVEKSDQGSNGADIQFSLGSEMPEQEKPGHIADDGKREIGDQSFSPPFGNKARKGFIANALFCKQTGDPEKNGHVKRKDQFFHIPGKTYRMAQHHKKNGNGP